MFMHYQVNKARYFYRFDVVRTDRTCSKFGHGGAACHHTVHCDNLTSGKTRQLQVLRGGMVVWIERFDRLLCHVLFKLPNLVIFKYSL